MTRRRVWVVVLVLQLFLHLALFLGRLGGVLRRGGRDVLLFHVTEVSRLTLDKPPRAT